jgi:hypothetical protein
VKRRALKRRYGHGRGGRPSQPSIYKRLKAAGCVIDNHESDLYVRDSDTARRIIREVNAVPSLGKWATSTFRGTDGHQWIDIPFAYDPWWQKRSR